MWIRTRAKHQFKENTKGARWKRQREASKRVAELAVVVQRAWRAREFLRLVAKLAAADYERRVDAVSGVPYFICKTTLRKSWARPWLLENETITGDVSVEIKCFVPFNEKSHFLKEMSITTYMYI
jgi:hypothetical protein